ncbi:ATPase [Capronia epimyces CBS 606.96]|uniref:ATPase n=1 Tax=Capronia epimyces CBS 606.96 TaxID=1182542 RepID=W9YJQ8_9EURO|nr:ATPase [Capronia epimyces CBS 606.96]EXJ89900.1 ATPase [Capronia epimyces CBS 606.96]
MSKHDHDARWPSEGNGEGEGGRDQHQHQSPEPLVTEKNDDAFMVSTETLGESDHSQPQQQPDGEPQEPRFAQLVRTATEVMLDCNPFLDLDQPWLNPTSPQFDKKLWAKTFFHTLKSDPRRYPQRTAGVSFQQLNVSGWSASTDYQKDVANVLLEIPSMLVEAINHRKQKVQILKDFEGLVRNGEMLVVLGRPGSGASTFLKTIAGQVHGLYLDAGSDINYQGVPWDIMHTRYRGEVVYQAETDVHFPYLTVGQTLLFDALAKTPRNRLPGVSRDRHAHILRDVVMAVFGLSHTVNTRVGNDYVRGVSGGERKRVSIAEVALVQSPLQCWDNSTRGLDSATALEFVKTLRLSTELAGSTAIVAIYQASQDAYEVFDKVVLLYEGRQIYFGRTEAAKQYFVDLGFQCPDRQTTADFLTSLTNPAERIVRPGFENKVPRTPDDFARVWQSSRERAQLLQDIAAFNEEFPLHGPSLEEFKESKKAEQAALTPSSSPYTISVPMQIRLCITRGFQRLLGNKAFFLVTVFGNLLISLVLGSVFYNLPGDTGSITSRGTLIYFAILFNALNSALEVFSLYEQRPIVEKQSRYALYHPFSEAISSIVTEMPSKILSTFAFNLPLYFLANLRREPGPFFKFLLFGFTCTMAMSMIFRTIGQTTRTIHQALTPSAFLVLALVIYTGYIVPTSEMQDWLRWINYLDPIAYGYESMMVNEFHGRRFPCAQFVPMGPAYQNVTGLGRACSASGALPGADYVDGGFYIDAVFGYSHGHLWRNLGILIGFICFFTATYLMAAEFIHSERSKGEVLVFRRGHAPKSLIKGKSSARPRDEESADTDTSLAGGEKTLEPADEPKDEPLQTVIPRQTSIFHWRDVCYEVMIKGQPRQLLHDVDGWVKPGTLTALMGASGAGKTTLLDVLASRVTMGVVSGHMLVDGWPRDRSFQRKTGYVQQQDLHLATATVRESLRFCAMLRQPRTVSTEEKYAYVEEIIKLLEMEKYAEAIVGVPGEGLNVEQRKRLTIGVELTAKPDLLLFLDEPTSGLDSQTAWSIAALLRKLSDNGQAILCTIHQPSAMLFQQFDRILLLARGGRTVYFGDIGPESQTLTGYFEQYGARPCEPRENPAEWMLEVIGAAPGATAVRDWPDTWRSSREYAQVRTALLELEANASQQQQQTSATTTTTNTTITEYAAPLWTQMRLCTHRVFQQYWRTPSYIYAKLLLCLATSIFIGASFYHAKVTLQGLQDQMFAIFMIMVILAFLVYQTMPNFVVQRDLYEVRERPSKTYAWPVFMAANIVVELAWNTLAAPLIFFPFYYLVGMQRNAEPAHQVSERGGLMFLLSWCFTLFTATFADLIIAGLPTAEIGAIIALVLFALCLIFCGVLATPAAMPGFWIFMYRVSPLTYLIGGFLSTGLANNAVHCSPLEVSTVQPAPNQTCADYLGPYMQMAGGSLYNPDATADCQFCPVASTNVFLASISADYADRWRNFGIMFAYILFNIAAALGLYWLARVPKRGLGLRQRLGALAKLAKRKS